MPRQTAMASIIGEAARGLLAIARIQFFLLSYTLRSVNIRNIFDEMIHVRYVDAGDDGVVRCNQLLLLTPEFRELPMMALPAQLHGA